MKITLISHASLLVETSAGGLLLDPWLKGSVLNNSWDLLEPSFVPADLWNRVRWIWLSHEHPDHFHPGSMLTIPPEVRARVLVLFQKTIDGRVRDWLTQNQFRVEELKHAHFFPLGGEARVYLETNGIQDSWIIVQDREKTFADLNDCFVLPHVLARTAKRFPRIDALMTQFSYASWPGNPEDADSHRISANRYLDKLFNQVVTLRPKAVIPAASFVRFSHVENSWMNDGKATVAEAVQRIENAGAAPIVLMPGDVWELSTPRDNEKALKHYAALWARRDLPLHEHPSVDEKNIVESARGLARRLRSQNNILILHLLRRMLGFCRPIVFFLTDKQATVRVDPLQGATFNCSQGAPFDVSMHSSALNHLLAQPWGMDTLNVSGRFSIPHGDLSALHDSFNVTQLNRSGIYLRIGSLLSPTFIAKMARTATIWYQWKRELLVERTRRRGRSRDGI